MDRFEVRVAAITGAASGIGRAMADALAAEGMRLVLADVEAGPLESAAHELRSAGADVFAVTADVSRAAEVERIGEAAMDVFGGLHVACNNAGVAGGGATWEIDAATWDWVLGVNLMGVVHGLRTFTPRIVASGGGHIVNTASMAGLTSPAFMSPYNASKHAVVTISESMFVELQMLHPEVGISVLCPGWVRTRIAESDRNRPEVLTTATDGGATDAGATDAGAGPGRRGRWGGVVEGDRRLVRGRRAATGGGRGVGARRDPHPSVLDPDAPGVAVDGPRPRRAHVERGGPGDRPAGELSRRGDDDPARSVRMSRSHREHEPADVLHPVRAQGPPSCGEGGTGGPHVVDHDHVAAGGATGLEGRTCQPLGATCPGLRRPRAPSQTCCDRDVCAGTGRTGDELGLVVAARPPSRAARGCPGQLGDRHPG
ncbi:MAG: SDR family NAD(P)-dependent oxidoreductase [Actinobacteria bacterium]|nr:SDR family NAD(P)-dependent oxidoreductase [Actinomycetota bacterium]